MTRRRRRAPLAERGQATVEYALVLLGAAVVARLVVAGATVGGGTGRIGALVASVSDTVLARTEDAG